MVPGSRDAWELHEEGSDAFRRPLGGTRPGPAGRFAGGHPFHSRPVRRGRVQRAATGLRGTGPFLPGVHPRRLSRQRSGQRRGTRQQPQLCPGGRPGGRQPALEHAPGCRQRARRRLGFRRTAGPVVALPVLPAQRTLRTRPARRRPCAGVRRAGAAHWRPAVEVGALGEGRLSLRRRPGRIADARAGRPRLVPRRRQPGPARSSGNRCRAVFPRRPAAAGECRDRLAGAGPDAPARRTPADPRQRSRGPSAGAWRGAAGSEPTGATPAPVTGHPGLAVAGGESTASAARRGLPAGWPAARSSRCRRAAAAARSTVRAAAPASVAAARAAAAGRVRRARGAFSQYPCVPCGA